MPLQLNPGPRVAVPVVHRPLERSDGGLNIIPPPLVVKASADQLSNESAPSARTDTTIKFGDELIL